MKYDIILFDLDGVITSEQNYWNAAALSVYELCTSKQYFGGSVIDINCTMQNLSNIRNEVFLGDKTIILLKNLGLNTNWDLAYAVFAARLFLNTADYEYIYNYYKSLNILAPEIYDHIANELTKVLNGRDCCRHGEVFTILQTSFNQWYYGDKNYYEAYGTDPKTGKCGLMDGEKPLLGMEKTKNALLALKAKGYSLGVGTGRPDYEAEKPMKIWEFNKYFDPERFITYGYVLSEEERLSKSFPDIHLTKPHPFMFLKGIFGKAYKSEYLLLGKYDKEPIKRTLVVGDAGADIIAAKAAGADFAAVLTGPGGKDAKAYFESMKADYIIDDFSCVINIL